MTNENIKSYLIDCFGYSEDQDLTGLDRQGLLNLVEDREELKNYLQ